MQNNKTISVYEHQRLYAGEQGFEKKHLDALLKLNEYHDFSYFDIIANGIKFKQYVGVIQVDGLTIEIHPKADKNDEDSKWKGVLLQMLQACGKLKASSAGAANVNKNHLNLLEVYFELYLSELQQLLHRGLIKQYRKQTANVKALKGKLEFAGHIQRNQIHKERFYTTHQVYDKDHVLHQVLSKALDIVTQFCRGTYLYDYCQRVKLDFPEVKQIQVTSNQLDKIKLNRKTEPYRYALELARLIILNYSPDISSGREKMISLLFDMNKLWEEYVLVMLQKYCRENDLDIVVSAQQTKSFINSNYLQPDIVIKKGNKNYIIDTKWKVPDNNTVSISDLRQVYAYARFWDAEKVMLLYPGNRKSEDFKQFENEKDNPKHQCKLGFVSVLDSNNKLDISIGEKIINQLEI
ncbi:restriction endonuclease [Aquimarina sp. BL5]|uniref:McrC family protein n=1 Tax=Aquimarina sp. BL5 TaxID=1714860 RepID=UPI000E557AC2|nr:restriction endonuclease [Aquimarina sp. BL5]AXT49491.1 restriction endonuclease [Aquimarina sp. BL5]RKN04387.1 restriction endonuclease [Aquimarina sp. BL5]